MTETRHLAGHDIRRRLRDIPTHSVAEALGPFCLMQQLLRSCIPCLRSAILQANHEYNRDYASMKGDNSKVAGTKAEQCRLYPFLYLFLRFLLQVSLSSLSDRFSLSRFVHKQNALRLPWICRRRLLLSSSGRFQQCVLRAHWKPGFIARSLRSIGRYQLMLFLGSNMSAVSAFGRRYWLMSV